ncbi:MAG: nucleotidyltransferase domain-containing protein [Bacteroidetes bacterium]|nr:nucleotidyltransferase domain-containing protein [Bacteroidota bacterium]
MDNKKDKIIDTAINIINNLSKKHNIKEAYIFGSYSKGYESEYSDIDVAIVLDEIRNGSPFNEAFEIFHEVQKQNSLFEVVCFSETEFINEKEEVIKHIKKDGIKIY